MKLKHSALRYRILLLVAVIALGRTARAEDFNGLYIGGSVGRAQIGTNNALFQSEIASSVASSGSLDFTKAALSKRSTAWWTYTGYMLGPYVGIEASYVHFGRLRNQVWGTYTPTGGTLESVHATTLLRSDGPALGFVFRLPLTDGLDLDFRLADYYGHTRLAYGLSAAQSTATRGTANSSSLLLGMGAAYTFAGHWSAKLDYMRIDRAGNSTTVVRYNIDMLAVGMSYTF